VSTVDPAPGWYPDPTNAAGTRWWDGRSWTQYRSGQQLLVQPPLPESLSTSTPWIVLQALIPLVQVLAEVPYMLAFRSLFLSQLSIMQRFPDGSATLPPAAADELAGRFAGLFGVFGLTSLLYLALSALWVVFAVLDARRLSRMGIVQPFHWAWSFLGVVYPIGRGVVLHRRIGRGLGPLWLLIGTWVGGLILGMVVYLVVLLPVFTAFGHVAASMPTTPCGC